MPAQSWVTLIVGVLAVVGVALTVRQRTIADKRAQAWDRITWCLDHTLSEDDDEAELGWGIYATVTDSHLITSTEREVLLAVAAQSTRRALAQPSRIEDTENQNEQEDPR
ncbi:MULTISPECIES: hypothetical protein [unclassified Rhodococcus (in: high G+C Gram-positive bacteria)]|uniref:hypothetical protein n=1 Tax=unclassified Rhodococcus (in: high G+C Gram-positive bacteria) TaxID=192944 RepID=UPI0007013EA4|nr:MULTISPECIES: hypothetical protein [unclassified Rhodococcus (in: high G+C Gram-positive bacteria)]KQU28403.1 hypothetical protein ASG69_10320 [Rhodococcus sp. Leaf225]KQU46509.1 hypothetical protein ASH03_07350 [Rhodococcus sp. Leaf258]